MTEIVVHVPGADLSVPAANAVEKRYEIAFHRLLTESDLDVVRSGIMSDFMVLVNSALTGTDNKIRSLYIETEEDFGSGSTFFNVRCEFERTKDGNHG